MCDYSLQNVKSRPAAVGDKLVTYNFGTGTRGFRAVDEEDCTTAVCVLPGTEIGFERPIQKCYVSQPLGYSEGIFRQINRDQPRMHHDALELPNGDMVMLTDLYEGQTATVLQLPAAPKNDAERKEQERLPMAEAAPHRGILETIFG